MKAARFLAAAVLAAAPSTHAEEPEADPKTEVEPMTTVVTGSRTERRVSDAPVTTEVIDRREIRQSDAPDVSRLLENHAGVQVNRTFQGATLSMEGFDSRRVLVLMDGERLASGLSSTLDVSRVRLEDVERIEIVKGAGSALYGSEAMGGVVNVIPRRCATNSYEARLLGTSLLQADVSGSGALSFSSGCVRLSGSLRRSPPLSLGLAAPTSAVDGNLGGQLSARGEWDPSQQLRLVLAVDVAGNDRTGVDEGIGGAVFDRTNRRNTLNVTLRPEWSFGDAGRLKLSVRQSWFREQLQQDQRGSSELDQITDTSMQIWQATTQYEIALGGRHNLVGGIEGYVADIRARAIDGGHARRSRGSVFLQDEWRLVDDHPLTVVPSVRADLDSQFGFWPSPRVAARWDPADTLSIHGGVGLGFRAPGFDELYLLFSNPSVGYRVDGNAQLKPEYSRNEQLGVEWRPLKVVAATLDLYDNGVSNLINVTTSPATGTGLTRYTYSNVAQAITRGGEFGIRLRPVNGLHIDLSYDYLSAWDASQGRALEGRSPHRVSARIGYLSRPWGLEGSVRGTWVSSRPFYSIGVEGNPVTHNAAPYTTLDVRLSKTLVGPLSVVIGGENLLNAGDPSDLPITPRNAYCGLIVRN